MFGASRNYLGVEDLTRGHFRSSLNGCMKNIKIQVSILLATIDTPLEVSNGTSKSSWLVVDIFTYKKLIVLHGSFIIKALDRFIRNKKF